MAQLAVQVFHTAFGKVLPEAPECTECLGVSGPSESYNDRQCFVFYFPAINAVNQSDSYGPRSMRSWWEGAVLEIILLRLC